MNGMGQLGSTRFGYDGETSYDESGNSVSMNAAGDRVAIGATMNDGNGNESGHVRIYEWSGTAWVKLGLDIDGEAAGDWSGQSVSMNSSGDDWLLGTFMMEILDLVMCEFMNGLEQLG